MKKLIFGFVFMLSAFAMHAQYVNATQAVVILESEATSLENGTTDLKSISSTVNGATSGSTITAVTGNSSSDISLETVGTYVYPGVMRETAKQIQLAGDTTLGVQNAEAFFAAMTSGSDREDVIASAFAYVKDLLTI